MSGPFLKIISPGPLCTVQDEGRFGYQQFGISTSGAVDRQAFALGNLLLGNQPSAAALEITVGGFEVEFLSDGVVAITGADLTPDLDGLPASRWETFPVSGGQRLTMASPRSGLRAYLCVAGGTDVPAQLGSRATYLAARLGGLQGTALSAGDEIPAGPVQDTPPVGRRLPPDLIPEYRREITVRVVPGPQESHFTPAGMENFFGAEYIVTDRSDRQGVRLDGPEIEAGPEGYDIVSDAVVTGAVQIPGDRKPIVLLADRQTTGGYPKIGVVATVDLPMLAQAVPGGTVRFQRVTVQEAQAGARQWAASLASISFVDASPTGYRVAVGGVEYLVEVPRAGGSPQTAGAARAKVSVDGVPYAVEIEELSP